MRKKETREKRKGNLREKWAPLCTDRQALFLSVCVYEYATSIIDYYGDGLMQGSSSMDGGWTGATVMVLVCQPGCCASTAMIRCATGQLLGFSLVSLSSGFLSNRW
jgi:hypothetical protein